MSSGVCWQSYCKSIRLALASPHQQCILSQAGKSIFGELSNDASALLAVLHIFAIRLNVDDALIDLLGHDFAKFVQALATIHMTDQGAGEGVMIDSFMPCVDRPTV